MSNKYVLPEYDGCLLFENYDYKSALIGVTTDNRAVYDYNKMVDYLMETGDFDDIGSAMEWIDYNTIRSLNYYENSPIIVYTEEVQE